MSPRQPARAGIAGGCLTICQTACADREHRSEWLMARAGMTRCPSETVSCDEEPAPSAEAPCARRRTALAVTDETAAPARDRGLRTCAAKPARLEDMTLTVRAGEIFGLLGPARRRQDQPAPGGAAAGSATSRDHPPVRRGAMSVRRARSGSPTCRSASSRLATCAVATSSASRSPFTAAAPGAPRSPRAPSSSSSIRTRSSGRSGVIPKAWRRSSVCSRCS